MPFSTFRVSRPVRSPTPRRSGAAGLAEGQAPPAFDAVAVASVEHHQVVAEGGVQQRAGPHPVEAHGHLRAAQVLGGAGLLDLGLGEVETEIRAGDEGPQLCALAAELPASVVVIGTRGRSGFVRAVLGSVSDFVVRNAPCPVVTSGD